MGRSKKKAEKWLTITKFPMYEVSTYGNVRNKETGHVLSQRIDSSEYYIVSLMKHYAGKKPRVVTQRVHRLVALAHKKKPSNKKGKLIVNHNDGDKLNNHIDNLKWCTYAENNWHSYHVLGKGRKD